MIVIRVSKENFIKKIVEESKVIKREEVLKSLYDNGCYIDPKTGETLTVKDLFLTFLDAYGIINLSFLGKEGIIKNANELRESLLKEELDLKEGIFAVPEEFTLEIC